MIPGDSIAWLDGSFIPRSSLAIQVDDLGFSQGVTAVERLRTWDGNLQLIDRHLDRFEKSIAALQLRGVPSMEQLARVIYRLLDEAEFTQEPQRMSFEALRHVDASSSNFQRKPHATRAGQRAVLSQGMDNGADNGADNGRSDVGVTLLATAGRPSVGRATVAVHLNPLDHNRLASYWSDGQPIVMTDVVQPPPESWPREIKVRSRLHYYLADLYAREKNPAAIGILLDTDGSITEASTCNVYLAKGGELIAPPRGRVLPGIMGETVCGVVETLGMKVTRRPIWPEELVSGHVWLTGSEGGLWFASSIDGKPCEVDPKLRETQLRLRELLTGVASDAGSIEGRMGALQNEQAGALR